MEVYLIHTYVRKSASNRRLVLRRLSKFEKLIAKEIPLPKGNYLPPVVISRDSFLLVGSTATRRLDLSQMASSECEPLIKAEQPCVFAYQYKDLAVVGLSNDLWVLQNGRILWNSFNYVEGFSKRNVIITSKYYWVIIKDSNSNIHIIDLQKLANLVITNHDPLPSIQILRNLEVHAGVITHSNPQKICFLHKTKPKEGEPSGAILEIHHHGAGSIYRQSYQGSLVDATLTAYKDLFLMGFSFFKPSGLLMPLQSKMMLVNSRGKTLATSPQQTDMMAIRSLTLFACRGLLLVIAVMRPDILEIHEIRGGSFKLVCKNQFKENQPCIQYTVLKIKSHEYRLIQSTSSKVKILYLKL